MEQTNADSGRERIFMKLLIYILAIASSISVGQAKEVCCHEYTGHFYGCLPMAFQIDPEVRGSMINSRLAYISGETADILRVLLLVRENDASLKKDLMIQISNSPNKEVACKVLAQIAGNDDAKKVQYGEFIKFIRECNEILNIPDDRVNGQPTAYCGPMNSFHVADLADVSKRESFYKEMRDHEEESTRIYLSALFLSIETDSKLILELKKMRKKTDPDSEGYFYTGE